MSDAGEGGLGVHSTGGSLQYVYARPPPAKCIFFSLRFGAEHGVVPMAEALRGVLAGHGLTAVIINMAAGGDIDTTNPSESPRAHIKGKCEHPAPGSLPSPSDATRNR
jgi:hypothetical protein